MNSDSSSSGRVALADALVIAGDHNAGVERAQLRAGKPLDENAFLELAYEQVASR